MDQIENSFPRTIFRSSLRNSKIKIDDFFKTHCYDLRNGKRFRNEDEESLDSNLVSAKFYSSEEIAKRRRSSLAKVKESKILSPIRNVIKVGNAIQKSIASKRKKVTNENLILKENQSKKFTQSKGSIKKDNFWYNTIAKCDTSKFSKIEIERQEAIYELYKSEVDLVNDIEMVLKTYRNSLLKLNVITSEESEQIFGGIESIIPVHKDLIMRLKNLQEDNGVSNFIGDAIIQWLPKLSCYMGFCTQQLYARDVFDSLLSDSQFSDFLNRCQNSPFSRKLDLWTFLEIPRNRLLKYPLLLKAIADKSVINDDELELLQSSMNNLMNLIRDIDSQAGVVRATLIKQKIESTNPKLKNLLDDASTMLCDGILRNSVGSKLYVFLLNNMLLLTRRVVNNKNVRYKLCHEPMLLHRLTVEATQDDKLTKQGSFRKVFQHNSSNTWLLGKNSMQLRYVSCKDGTTDIRQMRLYANDELDRQHWLNQFSSSCTMSQQNDKYVSCTNRDRFSESSNRSSLSSFTSTFERHRSSLTSETCRDSYSLSLSSFSIASVFSQDSGFSQQATNIPLRSVSHYDSISNLKDVYGTNYKHGFTTNFKDGYATISCIKENYVGILDSPVKINPLGKLKGREPSGFIAFQRQIDNDLTNEQVLEMLIANQSEATMNKSVVDN